MNTLADLATIAAQYDAEIKRVITRPGDEAAILFQWNYTDTSAKWLTLGWYASEQEAIDTACFELQEFGMNILNVTKAFPYLDACMFNEPIVLTIKRVAIEEVVGKQGDQTTREKMPVVYFEKTGRGLLLSNKTNTKALIELYGIETDNWIGNAVQLYTDTVKAFGKSHHVIRVSPLVPKKSASKKAAKVADVEPPEPIEPEDDETEMIPFDLIETDEPENNPFDFVEPDPS